MAERWGSVGRRTCRKTHPMQMLPLSPFVPLVSYVRDLQQQATALREQSARLREQCGQVRGMARDLREQICRCAEDHAPK
jgi:hypothetical protein